MNNRVVYILIDINNTVRYVGQGSATRPNVRHNRSKEYLDILSCGGRIEVVATGLSRNSAITLENQLIAQHTATILNKQLHTEYNKLVPEELALLFKLDATSESGLTWVIDRYNCSNTLKAKAGSRAGSFNGRSGWSVPVNGKYVKVHRVIWTLVHQVILDDPDLVINHIDGNPKNNNINNLELCTQKVNCLKRTKHPTNTTGCVGVKLEVKDNRSPSYRASVTLKSGQRISKQFSVSKYGLLPAYALAVKWRLTMSSQFYTEGA